MKHILAQVRHTWLNFVIAWFHICSVKTYIGYGREHIGSVALDFIGSKAAHLGREAHHVTGKVKYGLGKAKTFIQVSTQLTQVGIYTVSLARDKAFVGSGKASICWGKAPTSSSIKTHIGSCGRLALL